MIKINKAAKTEKKCTNSTEGEPAALTLTDTWAPQQ